MRFIIGVLIGAVGNCLFTRKSTTREAEPCPTESLSDSLAFLYASISDTQDTIRALDTKANYMLVVLTLPILKLDGLFHMAGALLSDFSVWTLAIRLYMLLLFVSMWALAFVLAFRTIAAKNNPQQMVEGYHPLNAFYCTAIFSEWKPSSFIMHQNISPVRAIDIRAELLYEQMKLTFIRKEKLDCCHRLYGLTRGWLVLGVCLWLLFLTRH